MVKSYIYVSLEKGESILMKEIKENFKKWLGLAGVIFLLYLVIRYWPLAEGMAKTGLSAGGPLLVGCGIAYVLSILMDFYERWYDRLFKVPVRKRIRRIVCMILAFMTLFFIVAMVIQLVLPELLKCIASFIRMIPGVIAVLIDFVGEENLDAYFSFLKTDFDFSSIAEQIEQLIKAVASGFGGAMGSLMAMLSGAVKVVACIGIGMIFSIYLLLDKEKLIGQSQSIITTYLPKYSEKIFYVLGVMNESFHNFIVGQCTEAVILGVLCILGMLILGFPYAVMIGVFIGFTALIPIAGAYIGAGVGAVLMLTDSPMLAVEFLIFIAILQQLETNLIYPRVVGSSIGLPGIWVLSAITIGGGIFGVPGMLFAVPLVAALHRLLQEDVARRREAKIAATQTVDGNCADAEKTDDVENHPKNGDDRTDI